MNTPSKYKGIPFQLRWMPEIKREFESLVKRYDPLLSVNMAVNKLVMYAIKENFLPGYERQQKVIRSGTENQIKTSFGMARKIVDSNQG